MLQEGIDAYISSLSTTDQGREGTTQNTIVAYRNDLNQASAFLTRQGVDEWQQVTRAHITAYLLEMRDRLNYRPTTVARKLASLKTFFRHLRASGTIPVDPIEDLNAPRIQKEPPHILSDEQVASLFRQVATDSLAGIRDLAMLHLLYATGMRASELVALNLEHIDLAQATVVCAGRNGRNRRQRVLPLPAPALEQIKNYLQRARPRLIQHHPDEQALFVNHHGKRLTRQGFWLIIKGYARQAGIMDITPHMLRHSFAILMLQKGMELRSVQELMGHAHIATTQVYSQLARESIKTTV